MKTTREIYDMLEDYDLPNQKWYSEEEVKEMINEILSFDNKVEQKKFIKELFGDEKD